MPLNLELTRHQLRIAQDLIRICVKHQITLQATDGKLSIGDMLVSKANPDCCHILNPVEKKAGIIVTLQGVRNP